MTGLRGRLEGILLATERVVAGSAAVRGTIGLTTGLDPDERVDEGATSAGRGANTETGTLDVAPVTPLLAESLDGVTAGIDDGLAGHASLLELGREELDVLLLVLGLVPLGVSGLGELSWAKVPGVPAGNVGSNTTDGLGASSILVDLGETLSTGLCKKVSEHITHSRNITY